MIKAIFKNIKKLFKLNIFFRFFILSIIIFTFPFFDFPSPFFDGVKDYLNGEGRLKQIGYPSDFFGNLDSDYRVQRESLGCTFSDKILHEKNLYNSGVKFMVNLFGFQKNTYSGKYPSETEAESELKKYGKKVKVYFDGNHNFLNFTLNNENYIIDNNRMSFYLNELYFNNYANVVINKPDYIIFNPQISPIKSSNKNQKEMNYIFLIDFKKKEPFALYKKE